MENSFFFLKLPDIRQILCNNFQNICALKVEKKQKKKYIFICICSNINHKINEFFRIE